MNKQNISIEKWEEEKNLINLDKKEIDKLVYEYLLIEGHLEAAEMFQKESNTKSILKFLIILVECEIKNIKERVEIRSKIEQGKIEDAISLVNDFNPEILESNIDLNFTLKIQQMLELIKQQKIEDALLFAQEELTQFGQTEKTKNSINSYLNEIENVMSLLAFEDMKQSPYSELLSVSQRYKTASELNSAILQSLSEEYISKLPLLLKLMIWSQEKLKQKLIFPVIDI